MGIKFPNTDKEYIVVVGRPELLERAIELGYQDVVLKPDGAFSKEEKDWIVQNGKTVVYITFTEGKKYGGYSTETLKNEAIASKLQQAAQKAGRKGIFSDIDELWDNLHRYIVFYELAGRMKGDGSFVETIEDAKKAFPEEKEIEAFLIFDGMIHVTDYTDKCGNCHEGLESEDKYCRYCGTKRGEGKFLPYRNRSYVLYGPPITTKNKCRACGYSWEVSGLGGDRSEYCPRCGKRRLDKEEERAF